MGLSFYGVLAMVANMMSDIPYFEDQSVPPKPRRAVRKQPRPITIKRSPKRTSRRGGI